MTVVTEPLWSRVEPANSPPYDVYTTAVEKSPQDDREYRVIRLLNGLEAMLVHDAASDNAAASLNVGVGHIHDPVYWHLL